ncbi:hypothetical protein [Epilithonimonas lactis]|uniref:hypothetical protein n=1 Tax=Epilithonimonas lactis TaxID=421072 RepID=UPI0005589B2E|nr:hypothetical protein [Epilithonimonas lactis]SEQ47958.1 hypothetical protein SAMN04488097_2194 [Epilithonimonas lactis]
MKKPIEFNYSDFDFVKNIALTFPDTEESVSHEGTPSVKVRGKLMCRLHDNGEFIPIRIGFDSRDYYLETYPEIFHLPEHFKNYPYICLWKDCHDRKLVIEVLEIAWRSLATKKQIKDFETGNSLD